jgi:hypothetical protein
MSLETKLLRYLIQFLNENYGEELDILKVELPEI